MDIHRKEKEDAGLSGAGVRLMSFDISREVTDEEIDMLAGATSPGCTLVQDNQCVETDC